MSLAGQCIVILGPTCSWKSQIALELALHYDAEIISCDSMQVYKGLDIGTAKPSARELGLLRHHLIDELEIEQRYDANRFCLLAKERLEAIYARGKAAVLVGGSGLYAKALVYGYNMLPADKKLAADLQAQLQQPGGRERLLSSLQEGLGGAQLPAEIYNNPRRLLRACEVFELCGQAPWELQAGAPQPGGFRQFCIFARFEPAQATHTPALYRHAGRRLVQEALQLEKQGLLQATARQALGYRDNRVSAPGRARRRPGACRHTEPAHLRYARRQLTWFKKQHPGAQSIVVESEENMPARLCAEIKLALEAR